MWLAQAAGIADWCSHILVTVFAGVTVVSAQIKNLSGLSARQPLGHGSAELWLGLCSLVILLLQFPFDGVFCVQHELNMLGTWGLRPLL